MLTQSSWQPDLDVTDHRGDPIRADLNFLHPPPTDLGKIITAYSSLPRGVEPMFGPIRWLLITIPAVLAGIGIAYLQRKYFVGDPIMESIWPPIIIAVPISFLLWYYTRFQHYITYVGENGFARFTQSRNLTIPPKYEMVLFQNADKLFTELRRNYQGIIYCGTTYKFRWVDFSGNKLIKISGNYYSKPDKLKSKDPYLFALSAERGWDIHLVEILEKELELQGYVQFTVGRKKWVRVSPGYLEYQLGNQPVKLMIEDIRNINLTNGGYFCAAHKDSPILGRSGKCGFEIKKIANSSAFLTVLNQLMGTSLNE